MKLFLTGASGFIGTNLLFECEKRSIEVLNYDLAKPLLPAHHDRWIKGDIMDPAALEQAMQDFQPTHVLHLAARTDCDENTTVEAGYTVNTIGSENLLKAVMKTPSIERLIMTSTQFVCGPGPQPTDDLTYNPHTVYGWSKVEMEKITRELNPACTWSFVRPVNIWGPWHMRYRREFWRVLKKGLYVHPGRAPVLRTYGYVGNVIAQIFSVFEAEPDTVNGKAFYVGDAPVDIHVWVDAFAKAITGKPARVIPRFAIRGLGLVGDVFKVVGLRFPITSSRFRSMITEYPAPLAPTMEQFGEPPFSLEQGVDEVMKWIDTDEAAAAAELNHPANHP